MEHGQSAVVVQASVLSPSEESSAVSESAFSGSSVESAEKFSGGEKFSDGLGPMERWRRALGDEQRTVDELVERCAEGERVKQICRSKGWPYSIVASWISGSEAVAKRISEARRVWAEDLAMETVSIADGADENVPAAKLQVETRFKLSGKLDREKWGDQHTLNVTIDPFGEMLKRVSERGLAKLREAQEPKVIEGTVVGDRERERRDGVEENPQGLIADNGSRNGHHAVAEQGVNPHRDQPASTEETL